MEPREPSFTYADELNVFPSSSSSSSTLRAGMSTMKSSSSQLPPIFESPDSSAPFKKAGRFGKWWGRWSGRRSGWTPLHDSTQCRLITRDNPYKFNLKHKGAPIAPLFGMTQLLFKKLLLF
jgi:hypothetical protein